MQGFLATALSGEVLIGAEEYPIPKSLVKQRAINWFG